MALIKCHECGKKVSTEASTCPGCGAAVRIPESKQKTFSGKSVSKLLLIAFGITMIFSILNAFLAKDKTPEELKQEAEAQKVAQLQKAEDEKKAAIKIKRISTAASAAQIIQRAARNPDSVIWEGILANDDASVVCFEIRAENGFGGMNLEQIAVIKGTIKTSDSAWNNHCANKTMHDVTTDVDRILKIYK
jgi:hypothetical protein